MIDKDIVRETLLKDITGKKFGRLTVLRQEGKSGKQLTWLCQCECGNLTYVVGPKLKNGHTKSCGCYHLDIVFPPDGMADFNRIYKKIKLGATLRNYSWGLTEGIVRELITSDCFYCGEGPSS